MDASQNAADGGARAANILVAGGTSTGKTTLGERAPRRDGITADRIVLIEDTRELNCRAENAVALRTKDGVASLSDLVRSSLRLRPDRIPIGRCAAPRLSTSRKLGGRVIPVGSARYTQARHSVRCGD